MATKRYNAVVEEKNDGSVVTHPVVSDPKSMAELRAKKKASTIQTNK